MQLIEVVVFLAYAPRSNGPARRLTTEIEAALRGTTLAERLTYPPPAREVAPGAHPLSVHLGGRRRAGQ